jgi:SAM-dependent methyltransferase
MKTRRVARHSIWFLCLLMVAIAPFAQALAGTKEFTPMEGQQGKDVIWLPTADSLVEKMLDLAKVTAQDYLIDLGSGDGRTVIAAAKRGARALGIEYNPDMVEYSKKNAAKAGVADRAQFVKADIFESDFSQANVITMFLLPELNLKLRPQILNLKPGTRIVSNTFTMGEWQPDDTVELSSAPDCSTYCTALFWLVPAKVGGEWKLPQGQLSLRQEFQKVSGSLSSGGKSASITNGLLAGDQLSFSAGEAQYVGRVSGNTIQGTYKAGGNAGAWSATRAQ